MLHCKDFFVNQFLDDHSLLLTLGGIDAEDTVHLIEVEAYGLLVVDGAFVHVELFVTNELLWVFELPLQVLHKQLWMCHHFVVLYLWIHD